MDAVRGHGSSHTSRRGEHLMGQKIVGQKEPFGYWLMGLVWILLVGAGLVGLLLVLTWPRH